MNSHNPHDVEQARVIVRAVFEEMGLDMSTPQARIAAQEDFHFLRRLRLSFMSGRRFVFFTTLATVVSGVLGLIWLGFQNVLKP